MGVAILRLIEGLDCSGMANAKETDESITRSSYDLTRNGLMHADSNLSMSTQIFRVQSVPTMGKSLY